MKVLITGSSGSIGSVIASDLIEKDIPVIGLDVNESSGNINSRYFKFYHCSITDKERLDAIFTLEQPTHVIHLACTFNRVRKRKLEHEIDVGGSGIILDICNRTRSVRQLIFSSSTTIYGAHKDNPEWLSESDPVRPGKYRYGLNKKLIEDLLSTAEVREDLHRVFCRICLVVGPTYNKPATVVSIMLKTGCLPSFVKNNRIQFIHTDDLTALIYLILKDESVSGVFNIAPDSYSSISDLVPGKRFIWIPKLMIVIVLGILWHLRLLNLAPSAFKASIHPIVLNPARIISRYNYKFKYSTAEAFEDVKLHNMIPAEAKF
jgi:UDP-glucose 4-epimerase